MAFLIHSYMTETSRFVWKCYSNLNLQKTNTFIELDAIKKPIYTNRL